jgi:hypothetical protein
MAGTIVGLFAAVTVTLLGTMPPLRAGGGLALAAVIVGGSYLPSLAVLSPQTNRPGIILLLSMLGSLAGIQIYTAIFARSPVPPLAWALPSWPSPSRW